MAMNLGDRAKQIISAVAPVLGATLGGPLGGMAGHILAKTLGVESNEKALENAIIGQSPEVIAQIRLAEIELQKQAQAQELDLERINAGDRDSARRREIAVKDRTPAILAYGITMGFFGTLAVLLAYGKPESGGDALLVMLGSLGTAWAGVIAYYFGSSTGSKDKTAALASIAKH